MRRGELGITLIIAFWVAICGAKDKQHTWRDGLLLDATTESRFYTQSSPTYKDGEINPAGGIETRRVEIWTYSIDGGDFVWVGTRDLRLRGDKPLNVTVNKPIKFAVENSDIFILDEDGKEHRLDFKKKIAKAALASRSSSATPAETGSVHISSAPEAAEITIDGGFMGNAPATIKLAAGKHEVRLALKGWRAWTRMVEVTSGSQLNLSATLERE